MKKEEYAKLTKALERAEQEALKYADIDDGGTCNFDSPMIMLEGTSEAKLKALYGEHYGVWKPYPKCYVIGHKLMRGQGNRHTKMAEAFSQSLNDSGFTSYVRYVMD